MIWEAGFIVMNILIAWRQAEIFRENKPVGLWFHTLWFVPVLTMIIMSSYPYGQEVRWSTINFFNGLSLLLIRAWFFNPVLNEFRGKPFFYLHGDIVNGSFLDMLLEKTIGKFYPYLWGFIFLLWAFLQYERYWHH